MARTRLGSVSTLLLSSLVWCPAHMLCSLFPVVAQPMPTSRTPAPTTPTVSTVNSFPVQEKVQQEHAGEQKALLQPDGAIETGGDRVVVNGIALTMPWLQWQSQGRAVLGLSDVALRTLGGIDLLDSEDFALQPVAWRNSLLQAKPQRLDLPALVTNQARYLDLTPFQSVANWSVELIPGEDEGQILKIQTRSILQISNLLLGRTLGNGFGRHDIQWSPGIRWQQRYARQGGAEFPVTQLRFRLGSQLDEVSLAPIWPADEDLAGIAPITQTAMASQVAAAINGGFFNRNNKTPLGAIRRDGRWISGPILNRGAIAWDDQGQVAMDRLQLNETLVAISPQRQGMVSEKPASEVNESVETQPSNFSLISLNSGYLKAGFSRYSRDWGAVYVPLTDNEVLIYVRDGEVIDQRETQMAGAGRFLIPQGNPLVTYLIVARSNRTGAAKLPVGSRLRLQQQVSPSVFADLPHSLGGGPLLVQEGRVVLDASIEGFSEAFKSQRAPRSAVAVFADAELALITIHERVGGKGPTLMELAQLLTSMGAQTALNLDGGSSTQLLLGGQLINRDPRGAARVHNGLGLSPSLAQPDLGSERSLDNYSDAQQ